MSFVSLVLPNYIFTYNGNQYVRVTPYAFGEYVNYPNAYKFSDDSDIGQVEASDGNSSNYRFFKVEPIKWIVLNYNYLPAEYGTGGNGTHTRLELLANDVLVSGIAPDNILWEANTINTYLNNTFNKEAFPKTLLSNSTIFNNTGDFDSNLNTSGSNNNYLVNGSNSSTQSLYLLSYYELVDSSSPYIKNGIFGTDNISDFDKRIPAASDYAKAHYQLLNSNTAKATWWQRTTDGSNLYRINSIGIFTLNGSGNTNIGTRPAMQEDQECPF